MDNHEIHSSSLVIQSISRYWENSPHKIDPKNEDQKAAISFLTQITTEKIHFSYLLINKKLDGRKKIELVKKKIQPSFEKPETSNINLVKKFVQKNLFCFTKIYETSFPFSKIPEKEKKIFLSSYKIALETARPLLSCFMLSIANPPNYSEELLTPIIERISIKDLSENCLDLWKIYRKNTNRRAGICLLWLIKKVASLKYVLPKQSSFHNQTVGEVLSAELSGTTSFTGNASILAELLTFEKPLSGKPLYLKFLSEKAQEVFFQQSVSVIYHLPLESWPGKARVIKTFFERSQDGPRKYFANLLLMNHDPKTKEIGKCFAFALRASDYLRDLEKLPRISLHFNDLRFERIFGKYFPPFCSSLDKVFSFPVEKILKIKKLNFNAMKNVFLCEPLMIGIWAIDRSIQEHYLLAYHMDTGKIAWSFPLTECSSGELSLLNCSFSLSPKSINQGRYILGRSEDIFFFLSFEKTFLSPIGRSNAVHLFESKTGRPICSFHLSQFFKRGLDALHVTPGKFVYHLAGDKEKPSLIGGKALGGYQTIFEDDFEEKWRIPLDRNICAADFCGLSTHCGLYSRLEEKWIIIGPTKDCLTLKNCMAVMTQNDQLYAIQKGLYRNGYLTLTIRTLQNNSNVASSIEKMVSFEAMSEAVEFKGISETNIMVLMLEETSSSTGNDGSRKSLVFIDLAILKAYKSKFNCAFGDAYYFDVHSGAVWCRNKYTNAVFKIFYDKNDCIGILKGNENTMLMHVDKNETFYLADIAK